MRYTIIYYSEAVKSDIEALPMTLLVRYAALTRRMIEYGSNLGNPHTGALGGGLFELRLKGAEGIARVFYCTQIGRRIVILHSFVKKNQKIPAHEIEIADKRMKEIKNVT